MVLKGHLYERVEKYQLGDSSSKHTKGGNNCLTTSQILRFPGKVAEMDGVGGWSYYSPQFIYF